MRVNISVSMVVRFSLLLLIMITQRPAQAEPYLAVQKGMQCSNCHVNPAGGGKNSRTTCFVAGTR